MSEIYTRRGTCRLCASPRLETVVPLSPMPIATPNFRIADADRDDPVYREAVPLSLDLCQDCGNLQVSCIGNRELQYRNYAYTTSLSVGLRQHFEQAAEALLAALQPAPGSLVVELGSNDGTLLSCLKARGMRVLGVDPARAIAEQATRSGIETLALFFGSDAANRVLAEQGRAQVIIANNMIANIDVLDDFMAGVAALLDPEGAFVIETQYGRDVINRNLLDTVYHEHLSYFNVRPLSAFYARFGLEIVDVERIETKGGSIRVTAQHKGAARPVSPRVAALIAEEEAEGHYDGALYRRYNGRLSEMREQLQAVVDRAREDGKPVAGFGVSVGTTTLLSQFGLTGQIDFLVDDDPNKDPVLIGPDYEIPVLKADEIYQRNPGAIVIFAWRYAGLIMEKHAAYREQGGRFVVPLPEVEIHG